MPTYDFECVKCHCRFEEKRSFSDNGSVDCPRCHGEARRLFSVTPIIFKGSGFYVTDHRKGSPIESESKAEAKKEDKPESKKAEVKEVKPAATTE
jgi:putative FmdB family regulatory protein